MTGEVYLDSDHEAGEDGRAPGPWFVAVLSALVGMPEVLAITRARSVAAPVLTVVVKDLRAPMIELRAALWGKRVVETQPARSMLRLVAKRDPDEVLLFERRAPVLALPLDCTEPVQSRNRLVERRPTVLALPPPAAPSKALPKPRRRSTRPAPRGTR